MVVTTKISTEGLTPCLFQQGKGCIEAHGLLCAYNRCVSVGNGC